MAGGNIAGLCSGYGIRGNDSFTKLLCHFDGANNATATVDSSSDSKVLTAGGNAKLSSTQAKFGSTSANFDGTNSRYSTPDHADFSLGSGDWTVDWWQYSNSTATTQTVWAQGNATPADGVFCYVILNEAANNGLMTIRVRNTISVNAVLYTTTTPLSINTWNHVAAERSGNTFRFYLNGVSDTLTTGVSISGVTFNDFTGPFYIGSDYQSGEWFSGFIEEFRFSKGVARYNGTNFTPPPVPYT